MAIIKWQLRDDVFNCVGNGQRSQKARGMERRPDMIVVVRISQLSLRAQAAASRACTHVRGKSVIALVLRAAAGTVARAGEGSVVPLEGTSWMFIGCRYPAAPALEGII